VVYRRPSARTWTPRPRWCFCRQSIHLFYWKVERIRSTTSGSATPTFRPGPPSVMFTEFVPLSFGRRCCCHCTIIRQVVRRGFSSIPVSNVVTPFLAHLFNRSLVTGCVPASFKDSLVTPILKKSGLDDAIRCPIDRYRTCRLFRRC